MLHLKVSYKNSHKHLIDFELTADKIISNFYELQLPSWRPGRYELQNFAKNIQSFGVFSESGKSLPFTKISKDRWKITTLGFDKIVVKYTYYAVQMDAGGTYLDEHLCYINWVTCAMYLEGRQTEPYQVELQVPQNYRVACGLKQEKGEDAVILWAENFYQLAAAPMIASPSLQEYCYQIPNLDTNFHVWIQGKWKPKIEQLLIDFKAFTTAQIQLFAGEYAENKAIQTAFPEKDYHFLFIILPYNYHHGVEHYNSTMLVMGVNANQDFQMQSYQEVLGICSHELFHFWNICRIRPVEMLPYDYTKENYFQTGFVAEGLTTYYGDYMLARSGVRNFEEYTYDINLLLQRHFNNFGRYNYSLAESSWDLWLDGYVAGIPNRKVSIYAEGALVAFILDIELRRLSKNTKSLDDVLRILWNDFALKNKGYSLKDYQNIVAQVAGKPMTKYFEDCIFGRGKIETYLPKTLKYLGYKLQITPSKKLEEQLFGFKVAVKENRLFVVLIEPNSPADEVLTLQDELISIDNHNVEANLLPFIAGKTTIIVQILRDYKLKTVALTSTEKTYLNVYSIAKIKKENKETEENFNKWLGN